MDRNHLARLALTNKVFRCRRKVKALTRIAQAEHFLNNPRAPGRRVAAQARIRALRSAGPGAEPSFDPLVKAGLFTDIYQSLFKATEKHIGLPRWVNFDDRFNRYDFEGMPRIDGALLMRAINLFANNKSCADDNVVAEMLSVLDEDVLDMLAEAFETRILNQE